MKFIQKFLLLAILFIVILTNILWLFFAQENESLPCARPTRVIRNASAQQTEFINENSALPEIMSFLPSLLTRPNQTVATRMKPSLKVSQHRRYVSLVIGIPSVYRNASNYLNHTLSALLRATNEDERRKVLIVVLLSDFSDEIVKTRYKDLYSGFAPEIRSGLIDVVSPPSSFYPNLDRITPTLGDPLDRTKWRAKQALDFAYIMMYAMNRGQYFLQLEDDVVATNQFTTKILDFAKQLDQSYPSWIYIQFAELGYIGKLFHNRDLLGFSVFYLVFHASKPVDWLLPEFVAVKVCEHVGNGMASSECQSLMMQAIVSYSPSLFQHTGYYSSLEGKIQPLLEKEFSLEGNFTTHPNPRATLATSLKHVQSDTLEGVYRGTGTFWGYAPLQGDYIEINLLPPIVLSKFEVISGSVRAPTDILEEATFEVRPQNGNASMKPNGTLPGFFVLASFDYAGIASGQISAMFGNIQTVRVNVFKNHTHWVAIRNFQLWP